MASLENDTTTVADLMREGRAQRKRMAEQCRQDDLKRTESANAPNPSGNDALTILPKELWEMVLDNLTSPDDLENASQSNRLFCDLLEPRRVRDILMPRVMNVERFQMAVHLRSTLRPGQAQRPPSAVTLLPLRSVCQHWRDQVDDSIQQELKQKVINDTMYDFPTIYLKHDDVRSSTRNIVEMLRSFGVGVETDANPARRLVCRSIGIGVFNIPAEQVDHAGLITPRFMSSITDLLEVVGNQILYLDLYFSYVAREDLNRSQICSTLEHWIALTPNVECFNLNLGRFLWPTQDTNESGTLVDKPFPHMKNLRRINLFFNHIHPDPAVLVAFLKSNQHIKEVDLTWYYSGELAAEEVKKVEGLIKSLELDSFSFYTNRISQFGVKDAMGGIIEIETVTNFQWQLKVIKLASVDIFDKFFMSDVIRYLNKFQTLEDVEIIANTRTCNCANNEMKGNDTIHLGKLNLPRLKKLILLSDIFPVNPDTDEKLEFGEFFDALIHCRKLEKIWLRINFREATVNSENQISEDNVWDLLPSLQILQMEKSKVRDGNTVTILETVKRGDRRV